MNPNDIPVRLVKLPCSIGGFVVQTEEGETIVLNSRHTREENLKTYAHELGHIRNNDFEKNASADTIETEAHRRDNAILEKEEG